MSEARRVINLSYDEEADVLYISVGSPKAALSRPRGFGVLMRYTEGNRIVGYTIIDFKDHFLRRGGLSYARRELKMPSSVCSKIEQLSASLQPRGRILERAAKK